MSKAKKAGTTAPAAPETPNGLAVILQPGVRPGLRACGEYAVGTPYAVTGDVATHLVTHKGFEFVLESDRAKHERWQRDVAEHAKARAEFDAAQIIDTNDTDAAAPAASAEA